jgi:hypothetical protein
MSRIPFIIGRHEEAIVVHMKILGCAWRRTPSD